MVDDDWKNKINSIEFYVWRLYCNEENTLSSQIANTQRYKDIRYAVEEEETIRIQQGHASLVKVHKVETPKP
jgi:hypothetical protein